MEKDVLQKSPSMEEISNYIAKFRKKFQGFKSRSPVFFTFQVTPLKVFIQIDNDLEVKEFSIDFSIPVEEFIHSIHMYLQDYHYPRIEKTEIIFKEPDIADINNLIVKDDITFEEAFRRLSSKKKRIGLLIDKIDLEKNKLVVVDTRSKKTELYQVDMPVLFFIKDLREIEDEKQRWKMFDQHVTKIPKR